MPRDTSRFENLLGVRSRSELRSIITSQATKLTIPEAQRLVSHSQSLGPTVPLRLGVIHTYTSNLLDPWLDLAAALQGLELQTYHAPYGLIVQEAQSDSALLKHRPDITLLLLRCEDLHPDLAKPLSGFTPAQQDALRRETLDYLGGLVKRFRTQDVGQIVLTLLPPLLSPGLGIYDAQSERSESRWWASLRTEIARFLREATQAALFLDLDDAVRQIGRESFFEPRLWYSARFPFTPQGAYEVARRIIALGAVMKLPRLKVIAVDADNTLWGGIVGEDGLHGIALGPEYPGNVYVEFQRRLLEYQQRGFVLALCSKNNPADVDEVLSEHPHQVLRKDHFAALRVNWLPKPENLSSLADELNLGLESFVFVDDSDHECGLICAELPQVEVVRTPSKLVHLPGCLDQIARLEVLSLTAEDLAKTELYARERRRRESREMAAEGGKDLDDYLASLNMKMKVALNDRTHLARLSQLTLKTNQFNLTTRRYGEQEMQALIDADEWLVADFALSDRFGDSGIVGLALVRAVTPERAELDTFLMSCRVIGRKAESAFLHALLRHLAAKGVEELAAAYIPTPKNVLVETFLPSEGFERRSDTYCFDLRNKPPRPDSDFPISVEVSTS